tara:strand:- start:31 stop:198 length:168 start_codon:yes stop_codon:yes gene_type:complete
MIQPINEFQPAPAVQADTPVSIGLVLAVLCAAVWIISVVTRPSSKTPQGAYCRVL